MKYSTTLKLTIGALMAIVLAIVMIVGFLGHTHSKAATTTPAASGSFCTNPAVQALESQQPLLDPKEIAKRYIPPAGEPAVLAQVNGVNILATSVEMVAILHAASNKKALLTDGNLLTNAQKIQLQESLTQLRHDAVNQFMDDQLMFQDGKDSGLLASISSAQNEATKQLTTMLALPDSNQAKLQFEAYLCVNHLSATSFASNPLIIHGYQQSLTVAAARRHALAKLQHYGESQSDAFNSYIQGLRQKAVIYYYW